MAYPYNNNNYNYNYNPYSYMQQPQMQYQQQPQQQTVYYPLTYTNGVEGAKAFIMNANQVVYLKDSDSNILFEKRADAQGMCSIKAFELKEVDLNNHNKQNIAIQNKEYITIEEFKKYEIRFENTLKEMAEKIEKLSTKEEVKINE